MLCYLTGMEAYYIQCIKDGLFKPKTVEGVDKPESQWNPDERRDEEEVSDDEEMTQVKVLMALADDEVFVGKNHARNGEWIDITIKKINILLSMDEDSDWQTYLKYININLKYIEEQRLNLLSKYNKIVFELNKCRDDLLALKQAKLEAGDSSSSESVSGLVTVCDTEPVTSLVPTEVKINDQDSKIDELAKLVQMLMDEKINST
ncbi:hypothetical protein Tco_0953459 [Tanacetum coccineum]|uniref:Retrovirus-related Pol polyprotein from transposon TNT 1-94 n=1 Tax=Tanacetum coccineum TaxID=301880 RepID=A0ABQ5E419_9ASTR